MKALMVADVMTRHVVSVRETTSFKDLVKLLTVHRVSALPVVDESKRLVGVVSEADLIAKAEQGSGAARPGWFAAQQRRRRWRKAQGSAAADVMTPSVVTIVPWASLSEAARRLSDGGLRRLFVVNGEGKLVGVIARRDVLRAFLRSDDEIARAVEQHVLRYVLWLPEGEVRVAVADGEVTLDGVVERAAEVEIAGRLTAQIPGVVAVHNNLTSSVDDVAAADA